MFPYLGLLLLLPTTRVREDPVAPAAKAVVTKMQKQEVLQTAKVFKSLKRIQSEIKGEKNELSPIL